VTRPARATLSPGGKVLEGAGRQRCLESFAPLLVRPEELGRSNANARGLWRQGLESASCLEQAATGTAASRGHWETGRETHGVCACVVPRVSRQRVCGGSGEGRLPEGGGGTRRGRRASELESGSFDFAAEPQVACEERRS